MSPSSLVTCCTQGVVTPNIVRPRAGRVAAEAAIGCAIIPASACAALPSTRSLMRLMPCTSVTACIMQMSLGPTYGRVSPLAMVETITLGTPTGKARMAAVASVVPPEPPAEISPPRSVRVRT